MYEFQNIEPELIHFYLRLYRENGKLRLEALREAISKPPRPYDNTLEFYSGGNHKVLICLYYDGLEADFQLNERIVGKILPYFMGAWFFKK
jgi:hypothetical protein